jgi:quinoprotein glucose dehydrogenase
MNDWSANKKNKEDRPMHDKSAVRFIPLLLAMLMCSVSVIPASAQDTVEWLTLGSDYAHTRSTPANQIQRNNFQQLEAAWTWDGASFQALSGRSTPS